MEINQPKSITPKMRGCKLSSAVNGQGALKQKRLKTNGYKPGLVVHTNGSKLLCQCWSIFPSLIQGTYMATLLHTILNFTCQC
jgi:hypothetical protein